MPPKGSKRSVPVVPKTVSPKRAKPGASEKASNGTTGSKSSGGSKRSKSPTSPKNTKNRVEKTRTPSKKSTYAIVAKFQDLQVTPAPVQSTTTGTDSKDETTVDRCGVCGGVPDAKHVGPGIIKPTNHNRNYFQPGDVIIVQHNTNHNDEVSQEDSKDFYHVGNGVVHSKLRPMIVLITQERHLLAIPIRSHAGKGLTKFTGQEQWYNNFFPLIQAGTIYKGGENDQKPLHCSHPVHENSCIDITDVVVVHYKENFRHAPDGNRLSPQSSRRLLQKWIQRFSSAATVQQPGFREEQKKGLVDDEGSQVVTGRGGKP